MKLIALVTVVAMIEGVRTVFEPGDQVMGLSKVDVDTLKVCGSIEDQADVDKAAKEDAKAEAQGEAEFQAARAAVQARQASIEAPADVVANAPAPAPAAAAAKKR